VNAAEIRSLLAQHGLALSRDRGQNFLVDVGLAETLVSQAGVEPGDAVIEIGTGLGILTRALAGAGARVVSIEIDAGLVRVLESERLLPDNARLVHADALVLDLAAEVAALPGPVRVVANLPYSISGPILRRLLDLWPVLEDWSVMLQRYVAERLLAGPGSKTYGSLSVLHQLCVDLERTREIAPGSFHPRPLVRSSFLRMRPRGDALPLAELARVEKVVRAAFSARRKTLANALRGGGQPAAVAVLPEVGVDPSARAESLAPTVFVEIARALARGGH
jgi:16S rRNA (adenine1518-N6/adenine1519-N6)-dimethyltransferase